MQLRHPTPIPYLRHRMDSLSQAVLGAATFGVVMERQIGKKALLIGAVAGTLPDLDVIARAFMDELDFMGVHRGISHSFLLTVLISPVLGYLFHRWFKEKYTLKRWTFAFFLAIITHILLDCCTTYGTKVWMPFSNALVAWNTVFVIDPAYTLPLLFACLIVAFRKRFAPGNIRILNWGLVLSTLYLVWGAVAQNIARTEFEASLAEQGLAYNEIMVTPTPFNTLLWTGTAKTDDGYYVGSYSLLDDREQVAFSYVSAQMELINGYRDNERVKKMLHFANGYAIARQEDPETIKVYSIKFGPMNAEGEPRFIFPMVIQTKPGSEPLIFVDESRDGMEPEKAFPLLMERLKGI